MNHTTYKVGVLTNSDSISLQELHQLATETGVVFEDIGFDYIPLSNLKDSDVMRKISSYDVIYYRTGMRETTLQEVARLTHEYNIPIVNASYYTHLSHKKIQQALIASQNHINQPKSLVITTVDYETIKAQLGSTFVAKPDIGSKGKRVELISSQAELETYMKGRIKSNYLFQEQILDAVEYRVYIINEQVVASYKKQAGANDFRANLHAGGSLSKTEDAMLPLLQTFGNSIGKAFQVEIGAADVLVKDGICLFLELNHQPGWRQLEDISGVDFAKLTLQYLLDRAHAEKQKTS